MITPLISRYLESHRRLVIPQLGAFVVKEPGQVLFSELLKRDDGVLRALLCDAGLGELEAGGEIDRFVFEVRHAVEHGEEYPMPGLGCMKGGLNGTIAFVYDPRPAQGAAATTETAGSIETVGSAGSDPAGESGPEATSAGSHLRPEQVAENVRNAFGEFHGSPSAKLNPESCVKGLRYGKPPKNTNAYTYVGKAARRGGVDRFLLVAAIAAVIAVAVIAFVYLTTEEKAAPEPTEQPAPEQ